MSDFFFGHRLILDFFNYDESEIIETVVFATEVSVYVDGILPFRIVPMFVYSSIGLLGFQLANILLAILATVAPGEIYRVLGTTVGFLADFEFFPACSVFENRRVYYVSAAHGPCPSPAGAAPTSSFSQFGSDHLSIGQLGLPDDIPEVFVATVTHPWLLIELSALVFVYLENSPVAVDYFLHSR